MNGRKMAAVLIAASVTGTLGMTGCGPGGGTGAQPADTSAAGPQAAGLQTAGPAAPTDGQTTHGQSTALLMLNDTLKTKLGSAYSDSWIEGNRLHVAVTTKEAEQITSDAGAIPVLVAFNAEQLETALQAVSSWQASLPRGQSAAIHRIVPDGRTGTITIYVAPEQIGAVSSAAAVDNPAGKVPLAVKESPGMATALATPL